MSLRVFNTAEGYSVVDINEMPCTRELGLFDDKASAPVAVRDGLKHFEQMRQDKKDVLLTLAANASSNNTVYVAVSTLETTIGQSTWDSIVQELMNEGYLKLVDFGTTSLDGGRTVEKAVELMINPYVAYRQDIVDRKKVDLLSKTFFDILSVDRLVAFATLNGIEEDLKVT